MADLTQMLKQRRRNLRLSQAAAADRLGIHQTTLSLWESGRQIPSRRHVAIVAAFLELTEGEVSLLLANDDDASGDPDPVLISLAKTIGDLDPDDQDLIRSMIRRMRGNR